MTRITSLVAALILVVGGGAYLTLSSPEPDAALPALGMAGAQTAEEDAGEPMAAEDVPEYALGADDAPVTVVEYASFTCPHCRTFHEGPLERLKEEYIDTGKVKLIYREVYFDRFGLWAAMVARCGARAVAGTEGETPAEERATKRYFAIVDMLYAQQSEWTRGNDAAEVAGNLRRIGKTAGLTEDQLESCLTDEALAQAMVARYQENIERDDISATPSFVIAGTTYSNMSYEEMSGILDEELGE